MAPFAKRWPNVSSKGEAEGEFRAALRQRQATLPANHPKIGEAQCGLGCALAAQGRDREARPWLEQGLPVFQSWGLADPVNLKMVEAQLSRMPPVSQ
ncbi:MAG: tetratricopeptide repeat protein [Acidobacteriota bacterium]